MVDSNQPIFRIARTTSGVRFCSSKHFSLQVNTGSPAEAAGLRAGDAVIRVNNTEVYNLRHKDAQDVIVRAGNNFELTVQR